MPINMSYQNMSYAPGYSPAGTGGMSTNSGPVYIPYKAPAPYKAPVAQVQQTQQPQQPQQNNQAPYQQLNDQQQSGNDQIEADYSQAMSQLDYQTSSLQGQAGTATSQIANDAAGVTTELGKAQATQQQGVNTSLSTAEKQGTSSMQQARDVYRQSQQQNIAQLSALGISSSSVAEALAERLGVDTARRIAGITGSLQEVRENASKELGRIGTYFSDKSTQLAENVRIQKDQIQQSLVQGLNQINSARQKASSDKAAARSNLLQQTQSAIAQLTQQEQQFQQSLQQWATQKAAALTPLTTNEGIQQAFQNFASLTQSSQFNPQQFSASMDINAKGTPTYQFGTINPKKEKDDIVNPFAGG